ncbi:hypothetical protein RJ641_008817 [Dillenia turbinata]|uniref:RING-type domain-containing protein n=1 Tax=Dillenia turbinata TaxID=194707 RepID=A0AAN8V258_9MAGN
MDESDQNRTSSSSSTLINEEATPSSSSMPSSSRVRVEESEDVEHEHQDRRRQPSGFSYRLNISFSDVASFQMRDDVWSSLIVLVTFWFFASMTLILGLYGSSNLELGPNCSRLIEVNQFFVQYIKVEIDGASHGPMLYGFNKRPPLNEWTYFLNAGSKVEISYNVASPSYSPLSLVIAQGRESLVEWIEDPSYPNTTLSWNIIYGQGNIEQEIFRSSTYFIAIGNLNSQTVEVQLNFTIKALLYNTSSAYYKCPVSYQLCSLKLSLLRPNVAVLTSPSPRQDVPDNHWFVKLSYGPRWITYFLGSGAMTVLILLAFRIGNLFQAINRNGATVQPGEMGSEQAPLLIHKDDDLSSWGSSYDCNSNDEEDLEERLALGYSEGKPLKEGENNSNPQRLCIICCDGPRDCFFLPCGHCAACFTCGSRVAEEAGTCPICRRPIKKVRKIFSV